MKRINIYEEANRCLMCQEAPCTVACKTGDPARAIRAIRFDNGGHLHLCCQESREDTRHSEDDTQHHTYLSSCSGSLLCRC